MKLIPLTNSDLFAVVDDEDFESLSRFSWQLTPSGYVQRCGYENGPRTIRIHRQVMGEPNAMVDHRDHNKLNNQKYNLRVATRSQNGANRLKQTRESSSPFKGVHRLKYNGKFQARIKVRGVYLYLGTFKSDIEAATAYNTAATREFGEFALLNQL